MPARKLPRPLDVHRLDGADGGDQVGDLVLCAAVTAPVPQVVFAGTLGAVSIPSLTLVKCQPQSSARARPVRLPSLRISRRRTPSASRACLTGVDTLRGLVLVMRRGDRPRGLEGRLATMDQVAGSVVTSWSSTRPLPEKCVNATVSLSKSQKSFPGSSSVDARRRRQPTHLFASLHQLLGVQPLEADVVRHRLGHDAQTAQRLPASRFAFISANHGRHHSASVSGSSGYRGARNGTCLVRCRWRRRRASPGARRLTSVCREVAVPSASEMGFKA